MMWTVDCGLWTVDCGLWTVGCWLLTVDDLNNTDATGNDIILNPLFIGMI